MAIISSSSSSYSLNCCTGLTLDMYNFSNLANSAHFCTGTLQNLDSDYGLDRGLDHGLGFSSCVTVGLLLGPEFKLGLTIDKGKSPEQQMNDS